MSRKRRAEQEAREMMDWEEQCAIAIFGNKKKKSKEATEKLSSVTELHTKTVKDCCKELAFRVNAIPAFYLPNWSSSIGVLDGIITMAQELRQKLIEFDKEHQQLKKDIV